MRIFLSILVYSTEVSPQLNTHSTSSLLECYNFPKTRKCEYSNFSLLFTNFLGYSRSLNLWILELVCQFIQKKPYKILVEITFNLYTNFWIVDIIKILSFLIYEQNIYLSTYLHLFNFSENKVFLEDKIVINDS